MVFVPVEQVASAQFVGESDGQTTVNDLYFRSTTGAISAASLAALANDLSNWFASQVAPQLSASWVYSHTRTRDLTSQFSFVFTSTVGGGTAGGVAGEQAPSNVAANITFSTGLAGRNHHGSNRVPAIPNSVITQNTIDSTWLTSILDAYFQLVAPSSGLPPGWTWVVVSRFSGFTIVDGKKVPTPRVAGLFNEIFDIYFTDNIVDSQKTRLPKHGR